MVSFLFFFLSTSLTLLRLYTNHHERAAWTRRTISASKSLLMPAFLPVCLERGEGEGLKDISLPFFKMCINLNWYYFIIGRSTADKRAISNDLCENRVNWPGDVFTIENSDWNKWPCVANCGRPYILAGTQRKEDEDGQQQLRSHAEPTTTIAYIEYPSSSTVTSPNVVQRDDARCWSWSV